MIEVQHLTKRYGPVTAVDDVSFRVEKGEILGFLGPNGAGKTTTMRVLTGYMPATNGKAIVAGYDVFEHPLEAKRRTGLPSRNAAALPGHDGARVPRVRRPVEARQVHESGTRAARRARRCGRRTSTTWRTGACGKLSKGYRQRVGLAQALIHDPEVLILDEPTAGLDPKQIIETRDLIRSLAGDHTIVLSTHILPEVAQTCQRVVIINKGHVVAVDTTENLTHQLKGAASIYVQIDGGGQATDALKAIPGVREVSVADEYGTAIGYEVKSEPNRDVRREVARAVMDRGWGLLELRPMRMSLEEIFLQLTTEETPEEAAHE